MEWMYMNLYIYDPIEKKRVYFKYGVPQGCINSPFLFDITIALILEEFFNKNYVPKCFRILFYVDDDL